MIEFRTLLLLDNLRGILNSLEKDAMLNQRCRSIASFKSDLSLEIQRLECEVAGIRGAQPAPSVGVPS